MNFVSVSPHASRTLGNKLLSALRRALAYKLPGISTVSYRPFTQSIYWKLESRNLIGQSRKANWCFELQFARADTLRERAPISHPFWIPRSQTIVKKTVFALYFFNRQLR